MKLRVGQADYYLGTCHTGAGASLGVLVGLMGSAACHTFGRGVPTEERGRRPPRRRQEGLRLLDGPDRRIAPLMARAIAARRPDPGQPLPEHPGHEGVTL